MTTVDYSQCFEHEVHIFCTEASMLGLPPGHFPPFIETTMGNGHAFQKVHSNGAIVTYRQAFGCLTLRVFND